jgi:phosphoribosylglycinamide formyltransferase-1
VAPRRGGDGRRGDDPLRVGVLISGTGTNLQALIDAPDIEVVCVVSSRAEAPGVGRAERAGLPWLVATDEEEIRGFLRGHGVELVVLAGYMQLLGAPFLARFPQRVINVHPALLPAFPGIGAVERAYDHGVKVFGVTVHFVDEGIDTGPIIAQRALELPGASSAAEVREALRPLEHDVLCEAVVAIASGRVAVEERRCKVRADDAAG